jgi:hypothetical protein
LPKPIVRIAVQFPRMKRFRRWLFNGLAAVSLVLCVASVGMWIRSHRHSDRIDWGGAWPKTPVPFGTVQWSAISDSGVFCIQHVYSAGAKTVIVRGYSRKIAFASGIAGSEDLSDGFSWRRGTWTSPGFYVEAFRQVSVPWWFLCALSTMALMLAGEPVFGLRFAITRHSRGTCSVCGYDLRATPDRCPECGTVPTAVKSTS